MQEKETYKDQPFAITDDKGQKITGSVRITRLVESDKTPVVANMSVYFEMGLVIRDMTLVRKKNQFGVQYPVRKFKFTGKDNTEMNSHSAFVHPTNKEVGDAITNAALVAYAAAFGEKKARDNYSISAA